MDNAPTPKKVLETHLLSKPPKVITRISPSQLGGCHRAHYYKIKQLEPTIKPSIGALSNFEVGFLWEQIMLEGLQKQKIDHQFQVEFYDPELNMSGTADFIIKHGDEEIMWDTKTQRSEWFWYRQKMSKTYSLWKDDYHYMIQQGCYLLMAKRQNRPITKSILAFISKDDGFVGAQINVLLTPQLEKEIMDRVKELNGYLERDEVPPCTCEGWKMGYCDMGRPSTMKPNKKKKMLATECCPDSIEELEEWRNEKVSVL